MSMVVVVVNGREDNEGKHKRLVSVGCKFKAMALANHCHQHIIFGYKTIVADMSLKYKNELYVLVTDQGYVSQPDLVWGKLNEVNEDTVFVTGDFEIFRQEAWIKDSWDEQKALTRKNNYLASSKSSVLSNDEKLPAEFQRKKYKSELQWRPTSKPASRVTTGLQVEPGHLEEDLFDGADDYWNDSGF